MSHCSIGSEHKWTVIEGWGGVTRGPIEKHESVEPERVAQGPVRTISASEIGSWPEEVWPRLLERWSYGPEGKDCGTGRQAVGTEADDAGTRTSVVWSGRTESGSERRRQGLKACFGGPEGVAQRRERRRKGLEVFSGESEGVPQRPERGSNGPGYDRMNQNYRLCDTKRALGVANRS